MPHQDPGVFVSQEQEPVLGRRRRPGPVYDDAMKILADDDLGAVLSVVGVSGEAERLNVELAASTMKADLLARTSAGLVHVEFVKDPTPDLDLRMVEYRLRLRRRHRVTPARGAAIQRSAVLTAAAERITADTDPDRRDLLIGAAATLASIVLPGHTIATALKEATMPVPVRDTPLGRELYEEGQQEGDRQAVLRLTRLMLHRRFGDDPRSEAIAAQLAALPDEERLTRLASATSLEELQR